MADDIQREYYEYLERFENQLGEVEVGGFAKYNGHLVQKLSHEEFAAVYLDYSEDARALYASIDRGDTINDLLVKSIRELANKLILHSPV